MASFHPLKTLPQMPDFAPKDVLVIFGEIFDRGYANGLVAAAEAQKMTVIEGTVGRREKDQGLRPLNNEELKTKHHRVINIPLEAGFDMTPNEKGQTPCDELQGVKISAWQDVKLNFKELENTRQKGRADFKARVDEFFAELERQLEGDFNRKVLIAHTMAGGVPRAKIVMPLMNRVFKGSGDRYLSSEEFWNSDIGKLCAMSFDEVTGDTLKVLLDATSSLRDKIQSAGGSLAYCAYGYHGTEVLIDGEIKWQTYSPYVQGWAKRRLEQHAREASKDGINVSVYNCPEILTNSSSIFQGVEVPLYPLLGELKKYKSQRISQLVEDCRNRLKDETTIDDIMDITNAFLTSELVLKNCIFEEWPQHSTKAQMEFMLTSSEKLRSLHKDEKSLMTELLSEAVFTGTGELMLAEAFSPEAPVLWLGHDIIAQQLERHFA